MADPTEDDQQQANIFYLSLQSHIEQPDFESMKTYIPPKVLPPADLEKCVTFSILCQSLTRKAIISPKSNDYLMKMFKTFGREDLCKMVLTFDTEQNQISDNPIPITCLYNLDQILPIEERLHQFRTVLDRFIHEPSDVIPQQLFYINAAAGIARPDRDISLELGEDIKVDIPEGAVTEEKTIYCHFVKDVKPCLLENGQRLVCYSIPVFLGPTGEQFNIQHPVILVIAHKIAPTKRSSTSHIRFFVRRVGEELTWREGGRHFCMIEKDKRAVIHLQHFSEFVIGVDPSTTTSLPPMRARMITSCRDVGETERAIIIFFVFDSAFMIKKAKQLLRRNEGTVVDVITSQEIILEPRVSCKIEIEGRRWIARDQVEAVTLDELDMLVFNPISRKITMIQEENTDMNDSRMCNIVVSQNTHTQEFAVSNDTFKLYKPTEDDASNTPEYKDARPEYIGLEKGSFSAELAHQRLEFKEWTNAIHENQKEQTVTFMGTMQENHEKQTMTLMGTMKDYLQQQRTDHQKQIDSLLEKHQRQTEKNQKHINELQKDQLQLRDTLLEALQQQKREHQKQVDVLHCDYPQQKMEHQKQIDAFQENLQEQRDTLLEALQQQKEEHQKQIDVLSKDFQQQRTGYQEQFDKLQVELQQQKKEHKEQIDDLQNKLQQQKTEHQEQVEVLQNKLQQQKTEHHKRTDELQVELQQQKTEHQEQIDELQEKLRQLKAENHKQIDALQVGLQQQKKEHQEQIDHIKNWNQKQQKTEFQKKINHLQRQYDDMKEVQKKQHYLKLIESVIVKISDKSIESNPAAKR